MAQKKPGAKTRKEQNRDQRFPMVATTLQGLEDVLAKELRQIGGNEIKPLKRAVAFTADEDLVYKANLRLRTALRILKPIRKFRARTDDELYDGVKAIDWDEFFDGDKTILIKPTVSGGLFTNSHYATLKCKDAIADYFREKTGSRPSVDSRHPDIVINLKIYKDQVQLSLDSSGTPLNKRGYRQRKSIAPLNECLAAGLLLIAGYDGKRDFIDGMCGSGTLCIEAAMIAHKISPGLMRDDFSFMHWKGYDPDLFAVIREATVSRIKETSVRVVGYDNDFMTINLAREAAQEAGMDEAIKFNMGDFFSIEPPKPPAMAIMNPPYGERIKADDIEELYSQIGDKLKADFTGYQFWILSGNPDAMKNIGLRTFDTHHLVNGKIPCRYSGFRMFR
jgi:putative N6-adenine-specific DNA methylase